MSCLASMGLADLDPKAEAKLAQVQVNLGKVSCELATHAQARVALTGYLSLKLADPKIDAPLMPVQS
jgi:hypothetical protein